MSESNVAARPKTVQRRKRRKRSPAAQARVGNAEDGGRLRAGDGAAVHPLHLILRRLAMQGRAVDEYRAPLFLAWQLTNRCSARCLACCEESGPDKAWRDELTRDEALDLARRIVEFGIPYVAFGGGEPLGVPHCWEIFERARGRRRRAQARDRRQPHRRRRRRPPRRARRPVRADLGRRRRPPRRTSACGRDRASPRRSPRSSGSSRAGIRRSSSSCPTRLNLHEIVAAYDLAATLGCERVRHRAR